MQEHNILKLIEQSGLNVIEMPFHDKTKGLFLDDTITLSTNLSTTTEKRCVLAEELGHYVTTAGFIVDQNHTVNVKKERTARIYAYNALIGIDGIIRAFEARCANRFEAAEFLGVTEEFFDDALKYYRQKYGAYVTFDNYMIYFEPLMVVKNLVIGDNPKWV